ncbi:MAG: hypothetical protein HY225_01030, partial [Candidatus Vogelbacteria bacterium]|nr:hypothetical protein [Candidatus Vogelbacteria bacterium]
VELAAFEKTGFLGDGDSVVGQQISVINEGDRLVVTFKIEEGRWNEIVGMAKHDPRWSRDPIQYKNNNFVHKLCEAVCLQTEKVMLRVASGTTNVRSARGLIRVEVPISTVDPGENILDQVDNVCKNVLGINRSLFVSPDRPTEQNEKRKQYAWSHKIKLEKVQNEDVGNKLERKEVLPGYFSMVENGRSAELMKTVPFLLYHRIYSNDTLSEVIKFGTLLATHERFMRGMNISGMSSCSDMRHGGGDGVFLRMFAGEQGFTFHDVSIYDSDSCLKLVFDHSILDRTDHYCYDSDMFGSTKPVDLRHRITAEQLALRSTKEGVVNKNEVVFGCGISVEDIKYVVATNSDIRLEAIKDLEKNGIKEINGRPIRDVIIVADKPSDVLKKILVERE